MIRWITEHLGTCAFDEAGGAAGARVLDVRALVDRAGNRADEIKVHVEQGAAWLGAGERVVVCCDYGMSRSNAVAAGILARAEGLTLDAAIRRVLAATSETAIRIEVLAAVREALNEPPRDGAAPRPRVLVTGATGFVGSALLPRLGATADVLAPSRADVDLARAAVPLDLLVREQGVGTIVHLANPRVYTSNEALGVSLVMLKNVLDVCLQGDAHLVYVSSWEVFSGYRSEGVLRADESLEPKPGGTYGLAKRLAEEMIEHHVREHGLGRTVLRSSPVYGPESDRPRFLWTFARKAVRGEPIVTHRYRNGPPVLDLLYIDDLVAALVAAVERLPGEVIHVGSGTGVTTLDVARLIVERTGSKSAVRQMDLDAWAPHVVMDVERAASLLGWRPRVALPEGIESILAAT